MGRFVNTGICALAAFMLYGTGHPFLFWIAITAMVVAYLSGWLMRGHAKLAERRFRNDILSMARELPDSGHVSPEKVAQTAEVPTEVITRATSNGLTTVNMFATLIGLGMLIWGVIIRFF